MKKNNKNNFLESQMAGDKAVATLQVQLGS